MGFHEQAGADGFREGCLMGFVGGRGQCQTARSLEEGVGEVHFFPRCGKSFFNS